MASYPRWHLSIEILSNDFRPDPQLGDGLLPSDVTGTTVYADGGRLPLNYVVPVRE
jgi:hypothetical protein